MHEVIYIVTVIVMLGGCNDPPCAIGERKVASTCIQLPGAPDAEILRPDELDGSTNGMAGSDGGAQTRTNHAGESDSSNVPTDARNDGSVAASPDAGAPTKEHACSLPGHCASWPMPDGLGKFQPGLVRESAVVRDLVTGLVWQGMLRFAGDLPAAEAYCKNLDLDGQLDWRVPKLIELISIFDTRSEDPTIDRDAFPDEPEGNLVWAARAEEYGQEVVYAVYTGGGGYAVKYFVETLPFTIPVPVRCVRGGKVPVGTRYTVSESEGTVTDNWTGLAWRREVENGYFSLSEAIEICTKEHGGQWHLPTAKELATLVDPALSNPSIDSAAFPRTPAEHFWSASETSSSPEGKKTQRVVAFGSIAYAPNISLLGFDGSDSKNRFRVRCVH